MTNDNETANWIREQAKRIWRKEIDDSQIFLFGTIIIGIVVIFFL